MVLIVFPHDEKEEYSYAKVSLTSSFMRHPGWIQSMMLHYSVLSTVQYKSLKVIQNGGKSKKSKTFFVIYPIEDLDSFY